MFTEFPVLSRYYWASGDTVYHDYLVVLTGINEEMNGYRGMILSTNPNCYSAKDRDKQPGTKFDSWYFDSSLDSCYSKVDPSELMFDPHVKQQPDVQPEEANDATADGWSDYGIDEDALTPEDKAILVATDAIVETLSKEDGTVDYDALADFIGLNESQVLTAQKIGVELSQEALSGLANDFDVVVHAYIDEDGALRTTIYHDPDLGLRITSIHG